MVNSNISNNELLYQTDLLTIQIGDSSPETKAQSDLENIQKKLSVIDFSSCEHFLKDNGYIKQNDSLKYSKTDWNSNLKLNDLENENSTDISSMTYSLYTQSGKSIDMNICSDSTTNVKIHLKNINIPSSNFTEFDLYNVNSPYYNDRCLTITKNETQATIEDKRSQFDSLNYTCSGQCTFQSINTTNGYLTCDCNTSLSNIEVAPEYGQVLLKVLKSTNIYIVACFQVAFSFVKNNIINIINN